MSRPPSEMIVMRHSERVDHMFKGWTVLANKAGVYTPYDHNMPSSLPIARPIDNYSLDSPITVNGKVLAEMAGANLRIAKHAPDIIYCSPSLRCLQTAHAVKFHSMSSAKLRIEPALLEYPHAYRKCPPLATKEQRAQFEVDESYEQWMSLEKLFASEEKRKDYYARLKDVLFHIAAKTEQQSSTITAKPLTVLVVGHATTVFRAAGVLTDEPKDPSLYDLQRVGDRVPYCGSVLFRRESSGWQPQTVAIPPVVYENLNTRIRFDQLYGNE